MLVPVAAPERESTNDTLLGGGGAGVFTVVDGLGGEDWPGRVLGHHGVVVGRSTGCTVLSVNDVVVDVPTGLPSRSTVYDATPLSSLDAAHERSTFEDVTPEAIGLPGAVGGWSAAAADDARVQGDGLADADPRHARGGRGRRRPAPRPGR